MAEVLSKTNLVSLWHHNRHGQNISVFPKSCNFNKSSASCSLKLNSKESSFSVLSNSEFHGKRIVFQPDKALPGRGISQSRASVISSQVGFQSFFLLNSAVGLEPFLVLIDGFSQRLNLWSFRFTGSCFSFFFFLIFFIFYLFIYYHFNFWRINQFMFLPFHSHVVWNFQTSLRIGKAQKWWEKGLQTNMKEVNSAQELVDSLLNAGDKLVVVDFFSPGCGGCRALHPKVIYYYSFKYCR